MGEMHPGRVQRHRQVNHFAEVGLAKEGGEGTLGGAGSSCSVDFVEWTGGPGVIVFQPGLENTLLDATCQDTLGGSFDLSTLTNFNVTGASPFTGLDLGATQTSLSLSFDGRLLPPGVYSESFRFDPLSENASSVTPLSGIDITLSATIPVPEPTVWTLFLLGASMLVLRRRRRME